MKQSGASRKILWGMQIALILLLIGAGIVLFRFSGRDSFRDIVSGKSFEDSREFTRQFTRDICDAISYTNLADRFETDGSLDVDKVVLRGKDENGQTVSYTLKNAIDYGQTAGIYFDDFLVWTGWADGNFSQFQSSGVRPILNFIENR